MSGPHMCGQEGLDTVQIFHLAFSVCKNPEKLLDKQAPFVFLDMIPAGVLLFYLLFHFE